MTDGQSTASSSAEVEGYVQHPPPSSSSVQQQQQQQQHDQSADIDADADGSHIDDDAPPPPLPQFFPLPNDVSSIAHHHGVTAGDKSTRWSARDDVLLCDALIAQNELGRCRNIAVFSVDAWEEVADSLRGSEFVSGGAPKTVAQCKARWQRLKTEFRIVKHIRQQPGFGWDEATQMVVAPGEAWDAYIVNHRDASPWRKKSFPCYSRVAYLIEDDEGHDKGDAKFRRRWEANIGRRGASPGTRAAVRKALKEAQAKAKAEERTHTKPSPSQTVDDPVLNATRASAKILNYGQSNASASTSTSVSAPPPAPITTSTLNAASTSTSASGSTQTQTLVPASSLSLMNSVGGSTSVFPVIRSEHNGTKFVNRFAPVAGGPVTTTITTTAPASIPPATINSALHQLRIASQPQANGKRPHSPVGEQPISKRVNTHGSASSSNSNNNNSRSVAPAPSTPTHIQHPPPPHQHQHNYTPGTIFYTTQAPPPPPGLSHSHSHSYSHSAPIPVPSNASYVTIPGPPPPPPASSSSSGGTPQPYTPATVHVHQIPISGSAGAPLFSPPPLPPAHSGAVAAGPTRLAEAIQVLEATFTEDGFSEAQFVKAVRIFEKRGEAADAYLAIQSRRARVLFLKAELEEFGSGAGGAGGGDGKGSDGSGGTGGGGGAAPASAGSSSSTEKPTGVNNAEAGAGLGSGSGSGS